MNGKLKVYWNLHKKSFSVCEQYRIAKKTVWKVTDYCEPGEHLVLTNCKFTVQPAGRERVRRERRKNVHAWVTGEHSKEGPKSNNLISVHYNPYKTDWFVDEYDRPVLKSDWAILINDDRTPKIFIQK